MENPLEAGREEIEHIEHLSSARLRVIVTVMILAVTMVTTLAGVMAAIWSAHQSEAQRARQQATADATISTLRAASERNAVSQQVDDDTELLWRQTFLTSAENIATGSVATELKAYADVVTKQEKALVKQIPKEANTNYTKFWADLQQPAVRDDQLAQTYAQQGVGWLDKHNEALAVVSILALALFLLGLVLTVGHRPTQLGFTALSVVMLLIAGGWLAQIAAQAITVPTGACMDNYARAYVAQLAGSDQQADKILTGVVAACPQYSAAWDELGSVRFDEGTAAAIHGARSAWQRALEVAPTKSAILYNDLGFAALLSKDYGTAAGDIGRAQRMEPDNYVVLGSAAELALARGDTAVANADLDKVIYIADHGHGAYFRETVFGSFRDDAQSFATAGITGPQVTAFFTKAKEAEASFDSLHRSTPGSAHGAKITDVILRKSKGELGRDGYGTVGFTYSGLRGGDHLALRFYANGTSYEPIASLPNVPLSQDVASSGVLPPDEYFNRPLLPGAHTLEIYLNGVLLSSTSFTMPS